MVFDHPNDKNEDRPSRRKVQIIFGSARGELGIYVAERTLKTHQFSDQSDYTGRLIAPHGLKDLQTHGEGLLREDLARAVNSIGTFKRRA